MAYLFSYIIITHDIRYISADESIGERVQEVNWPILLF